MGRVLGRVVLWAFVAGTCLAQQLAVLWPLWFLWSGLAMAVVGIMMAFAMRAMNRTAWRTAACGVAALLCGVIWAQGWAHFRLADQLPMQEDNQIFRMQVRVATLPQYGENGVRFEAYTLSARPARAPHYLRVAWYARPGEAAPRVLPGQVWRMALRLRRVHGLYNPDGRDAEAQALARGVRASATVRGTPELLADLPWSGLGVPVERLRTRLRDRMAATLTDASYAGVILALALGDQSAITPAQWETFNRCGITHLVAISGLHVSLVAGLAFAVFNALWRRLRWRGVSWVLWLPAQSAGACAALLVGTAYCLLAGWGIPAQRTCFTLAVGAAAVLAQLPLSVSRGLAVAAALVAAVNPWAGLSAGFWLSFGAVALLWMHGRYGECVLKIDSASTRSISEKTEVGKTAAGKASPGSTDACAAGAARRPAWLRWLADFQLHCRMEAGLLPLLALWVGQVSWISPVANLIAVPVVSLLVTPLALLSALAAALPATAMAGTVSHGLGMIADYLLRPVMALMQWMSAWSWAAMPVRTPPWPVVFVAVLAVIWAMMPPGLPGRRWAWCLAWLVMAWPRAAILPGQWQLVALDVGQGGAVVVRTAHHTLLFDAGPRSANGTDAGQRVVVPYLHAQGIRWLDVLVVSHADLDHVGGAPSLLYGVPVTQAYASFDLPAWLRRDHLRHPLNPRPQPMPDRAELCRAGTHWEVDGVSFDFVFPYTRRPTGHNGTGCVLRVRGAFHTALLTGDIGARQEQRIVESGQARADLVLAGHHGSATSSSAVWVAATQAREVIVQAGYDNAFGHPKPQVVRRWQQSGARVWRNDRDGAVMAESSASGLTMHAWRQARPRYWLGQ